MEKKYIIFYYDTDKEGFPILDSSTLQDISAHQFS